MLYLFTILLSRAVLRTRKRLDCPGGCSTEGWCQGRHCLLSGCQGLLFLRRQLSPGILLAENALIVANRQTFRLDVVTRASFIFLTFLCDCGSVEAARSLGGLPGQGRHA